MLPAVFRKLTFELCLYHFVPFGTFFCYKICTRGLHHVAQRRRRTCSVGSRVSSDRPRLCVSVCRHDKIKTAETTITKLGTGIVHHDTSLTN